MTVFWGFIIFYMWYNGSVEDCKYNLLLVKNTVISLIKITKFSFVGSINMLLFLLKKIKKEGGSIDIKLTVKQ